MFGVDEVAQLAAHQRAGTLGVFADHHFVPDAHLLLRLDLNQLQGAHIPDLCGYANRVGYGTVQTARIFGTVGCLCNGQGEVTLALQFAQCFGAATDLLSSSGIVKVEVLTQGFGQRGAVSMHVAVEFTTHDIE